MRSKCDGKEAAWEWGVGWRALMAPERSGVKEISQIELLFKRELNVTRKKTEIHLYSFPLFLLILSSLQGYAPGMYFKHIKQIFHR